MPTSHTLPAPIVVHPAPSRYTAPVGARPADDHDRWVADGFEAAHQAWLDEMGHVHADVEQTALDYEGMFPRLRRVGVLLGAPR